MCIKVYRLPRGVNLYYGVTDCLEVSLCIKVLQTA